MIKWSDNMIKIQIDIPYEFEREFERDRFKDSLERLVSDIHCMAGNYEKETAEMLIVAFQNGKVIK